MKKQNYLLLTVGATTLFLIFAGCSAPSTNTAANVSNKSNPNIPVTNANGGTINNTNGGMGSGGANSVNPH